MSSSNQPPSGVLLVDKPKGCTSHDVVDRARRALGLRKIGHAGTLDPSATGLLVLTVGQATRLSRFLTGAPKIYQGTIRFGIATDTYDAAGEVTSRQATDGLERSAVERAMQARIGAQEQVAPAFSAKKFAGRKGYELAREGKPVPRRTSSIEVYRYDPIGELENDRIDFELECSAGTYARSLSHDVGEDVGVGAHLARLRRVGIGPLRVSEAATLEDLEGLITDTERRPPGELGEAWIPFSEIPLPFPDLQIDVQQAQRIANGQTVLQADQRLEEGDWVRLLDAGRRCVAIAVVVESIGERGLSVLQPKIVFPQ
ncbi:MAG: tRNA pseudouridine(55) synthase TruB [Acidobacteria bacterium]|nr:MAG: tRNA pseudouridine(55) synthase TruB [Acidobacteriota bacterium]REK00205.1 MAG: tRNA pseudouridine(55) synthase TruB [Acidobacteriota bacterium]